MSHGIGQKVHGRPVHPIQIITFSMPNALSCSVNVVVLEKFPETDDMELDGTGNCERSAGWS